MSLIKVITLTTDNNNTYLLVTDTTGGDDSATSTKYSTGSTNNNKSIHNKSITSTGFTYIVVFVKIRSYKVCASTPQPTSYTTPKCKTSCIHLNSKFFYKRK